MESVVSEQVKATELPSVKKLYNVSECAGVLGLSDSRVRQMCLEHKFTGAWKHSERSWIIPRTALFGYLKVKEEKLAQKEEKKNGSTT